MSYNLTYLTNACVERSRDSWGMATNHWDVMQWGCAAAGEMGEACNIAKKLGRVRQGIRQDLNSKGKSSDEWARELENELGREIADTIWYLLLWAASEGLDINKYMKITFNNKSLVLGSGITI